MQQSDIEDAAMFLVHLRTQRSQVTGFPGEIAPKNLDDAYAIQDNFHRFIGEPISAIKIGCTSAAAQEFLNVPHPIAGRIPASGVFGSGDTVPHSYLHSPPLLECEIAVRIAADGAIDAYAPAIELVNSRFSDTTKVGAPGLVADNSAGTATVIGAPIALDAAPDMADLGISLRTGDEEIAAGSSTALVGGIDSLITWVSAHEASRERVIEPGTWVITGTCTGLTPAAFGMSYVADFGSLGAVSFSLGEDGVQAK